MFSVSLRTELLIVSLLLVLASGFSFYRLTESPPVWYDEGYYIQAALSVAETGGQSLQVAPGERESVQFVTVGFPLIYPLAAVFKVFGVGVFQARAVVVFFLLGFLVVSYVLIRSLAGVPAALSALVLVATFPPLFGNGKSVLGEVPGLMFLALTLLTVQGLERSRFTNVRLYALTGLLGGLTIVTKPLYILLVPAVCIALLIVHRRMTLQMRGVLVCIASGLVPLVIWFFTQFQSGDSLSSVLQYYANPYGATDILGLIQTNVWRFFSEMTPLYALVAAALWAVSIAVRAIRGAPIMLAEWIAVLFCVAVFLAYLRTPGWYRYFFPAHTIAVLFLPLAVLSISDWLGAFQLKHRMFIRGVLVVGACLVSLHMYQLLYSSWVATSYSSTRSADLTRMSAMLKQTPVFFYDTPELVIFLNSKNYYQYLHPAHGSVVIGKAQLARLSDSAPLTVIVKSSDRVSITERGTYRTIREVAGYSVLTNVPE